MIKQIRYNYRSINIFFIIFLEVIIICREKSLLIQDGAKLFASVEGRKFHEAKISMYTVSPLCSYKSVRKRISMYCKSNFIRNIFCDLFCTNGFVATRFRYEDYLENKIPETFDNRFQRNLFAPTRLLRKFITRE